MSVFGRTKPLKVPVPRSGGLILSYQCNAACRHCMYACGPRWPSVWMSQADLNGILSALGPYIEPSAFGPNGIGLNEGLHFTGGEPFLRFELLCEAVSTARDLGIPSLFVETNCFWCTDRQTTFDKLTALKDRGLAGIMISVNPFYLEHVPFERTLICVQAARELFGPFAVVYQVEYFRRFLSWGVRGTMPLQEYLEREAAESSLGAVEFFMSGRAPYALRGKLSRQLAPFFRPRSALEAARESCPVPFARSWHNHFDCYGNYVPGYCAGISYGDIRQLEKLLSEGIDPEDKPILALLMREDLPGLLRFAKARGFREDPAGYFSACHLCMEIRRFLFKSGSFKELAPGDFYRQLDLEEQEKPEREN